MTLALFVLAITRWTGECGCFVTALPQSTASVPAAAAPRLDVSAREKSLRESSKQRKRDAESNNSPVVRTIPGRSPVVRKQV